VKPFFFATVKEKLNEEAIKVLNTLDVNNTGKELLVVNIFN